MNARPFIAALAFAFLLASSTARAEDAATTETAVRLSDEASDLFQAGKFADAMDRYERAFALVRRPTLGVRIARCLEKLGRLNESADRYLAVSRMSLPADLDPDKAAKQREAIAQAGTERTALMPRIPSIVVNLTGPSTAGVTIDGQPVPRAVFGLQRAADPGAHHIEARSGADVVARDVTLAEGQVQQVALELRMPVQGPDGNTDHKPSRSPLRTAGYIGIGVGAAGVVLGAVTGAMALSGKSDLEGKCGPQLACDPAHKSDADAYNTLRTVSSVGFIAGSALAAAGIVIFIAAPKNAPVTATISPSGAVLLGSF